MHGRVSVCVVVVALVAWLGASSARAGTATVLLKSGDVAPDGRTLAAFADPVATGATTVAFRGTTAAILTRTGSGFGLIAKTGDSLAGAGLTGTINNVFTPAISDGGLVAFRATLNSTDADTGIFLSDGVNTVPLLLVGGTSGGTITTTRPLDVDDVGLVVFDADDRVCVALGSCGAVAVAGGTSPGGGAFQSFSDRPVVGNSPTLAVVFEAEVVGGPDGIFTQNFPGPGLTAVALTGGASPIAGGTWGDFDAKQALSVNASGMIAFTSDVTLPGPDTSGVFLYDPTGPTITTIAKEGDLVDGQALTAFEPEYVGVNDAGEVAFEGRIGTTRKIVLASGGTLTTLGTVTTSFRDVSPHLNASHAVIGRTGNSVQRIDGATTTLFSPADTTAIGLGGAPSFPGGNQSGVVAFRATQDVLYRLAQETVTPIATPGDAAAGGGTIQMVLAHTAQGRSIAYLADLGGGQRMIGLVRSGSPATRLVDTSTTTPAGGLYGLFDPQGEVTLELAVQGSTVLFESQISGGSASSGIFRVDTKNGDVEALALASNTGPFSSFDALAAAGREAAFIGSGDAGTGVYLTGRNGPTPLALVGDAVPGRPGDTFYSFGGIVASGRRLAFTARVLPGLDSGVFVWDRGTLRTVLITGDTGPGGGTFDADVGNVVPPPLALHGRGLAFVSPFSSAFSDGIFLDMGGISTILLDTDPTPLGGTYQTLLSPLSYTGRAVVLEAALTPDAGVQNALVSVRR